MNKKQRSPKSEVQKKSNKSSAKMTNPEINATTHHQNKASFLDISQLQQFVQSKINDVNQLYRQLIKFDMTEEQVNAKNRVIRFGEACYSQSHQSLVGYITPALDDIYQTQRQCFKKINALQTAYGKIREILQDSKELNDIEIDQVLNNVQKKIDEEKHKIESLQRIGQKGRSVIKQKYVKQSHANNK